ncbi:MAG TPA: polysaccharide deacetylase family protein [Gemmataceae bacterium]|nr:polysaccharide deacetylase family protein [Gemmataceae bacterium]
MKTCWMFFATAILSVLGVQVEGARAVEPESKTWGERLGWPAGKRVVIFHADDVGMCYEASQAAQQALTRGDYRSAAAMVPCPWFNEMAAWCVDHPEYDVGLHLTFTSEWKYYRWAPVAPHDKVKGLIDPFGYMFADVRSVALSAQPGEVATEIRAQLARARKFGMQPSHIDTHMGTVYARPDYTQAYLRVAMEEQIPAMVIEMTPRTIEKFKNQGYPITAASLKLLAGYTLPKLDDFHSVGEGKTYEQKREKFLEQIRLFPAGLNEIIFHPSIETEGLKKITHSWQQRAWENRLLGDPVVQRYIRDNDIIVTDWKEVMARFKKHAAGEGPAASKAGQ